MNANPCPYTDEEIAKRFMSKKKSSAKRGIFFQLSLEEYLRMFRSSDGHCAFTGLPMKWVTKQEHTSRMDIPSVERIDAKKGYESGNICLIRRDVNCTKGTYIDSDKCRSTGSKSTRKLLDTIKEVINDKGKIRDILMPYTAEKYLPKLDKVIEEVTKEVSMENVHSDIYLVQLYLKFTEEVGGNIPMMLSFAEFKRKMSSKKCKLTGREFNVYNGGTEDRSMMILDMTKEITSQNVIVVQKDLVAPLINLRAQAKLTQDEFVKTIKKLGKVL